MRRQAIFPAVEALARKVREVYDRIHLPESSPMLDFDKRDLLTFTEQVGFAEIHLNPQIEFKQPQSLNPTDDRHKPRWETFLRLAGNPSICVKDHLSRFDPPQDRFALPKACRFTR